MSYRERMHPRVSKAELEVFNELSKRGLTAGLVTQESVILKETLPDFMWRGKRKVVYLDGEQVHRKRQEYDEEIDFLLEKRGWRVLRISYSAPLGKAKLAEVLSEIEGFIGEV